MWSRSQKVSLGRNLLKLLVVFIEVGLGRTMKRIFKIRGIEWTVNQERDTVFKILIK